MTFRETQKQNRADDTAAVCCRRMPGQTIRDGGIEFAVRVDSDEEAAILLYHKGSEHVRREVPLSVRDALGSIRRVFVPGLDPSATEYNIRVGTQILQDPYAQIIVGRTPFGHRRAKSPHQIRCGFRQSGFDWAGDRPLQIPFEDVISYSLHVRGFTKDKSSGVKDKGTYAGITQKIPYMKELGINQIILMPAYEFDEMPEQKVIGADWMRPPENVSETIARYAVPAKTHSNRTVEVGQRPGAASRGLENQHRDGNAGEGQRLGEASSQGPENQYRDDDAPAGQAAARRREESGRVNFWGYTTAWYFAPKFGYSATGAPDVEFKEMVRQLHRAGIEVVMQMAFVPETDISLMIDALVSWVQEYHVDGFELMVSQENAQALARVPELRMTKLIAGYFDTGAAYPQGRRKAYRNLADKNDGFRNDCRRLLKSDENMLYAFVERVKANDRDKGCINYITCHDGFTLMDLVSYNKKHNEQNGQQGQDGSDCDFSWNCGAEGPTRKKAILNLRLRQMKNAMVMLMLSQGTPMLRAGDECCNSQNGNNNPWCIDSECSYVTWNRTRMAGQMTAFVKELIAFRKAHPILHQAKPLTGTDTFSCGYPDFSLHGNRAWYGAFEYQSRHVGIMYCSPAQNRREFIYVAYNFHWDVQEFALPYLPDGLKWQIALDTGTYADPGSRVGGGQEEAPQENAEHVPVRLFSVPGRTIRVLVSAEDTKIMENAEASEETAGQSSPDETE